MKTAIPLHRLESARRELDNLFPKWQSLLPSDPVVTATVLSEDLTDALARAALTAAEIQKGKLVTLELGDGILVKADGFTELVEADVEGVATVSLNVKYLTEAVAPVERATLKALDAYKPVLVEGGGWWNALVMPVRQ